MSFALESARHDWEQGHRRLQEYAGDPLRYSRLLAQIESVTDELRRRIGQSFTLLELAQVYAGAEDWAREAVAEQLVDAGSLATLRIAQDAAFHLYARGAIDYRP